MPSVAVKFFATCCLALALAGVVQGVNLFRQNLLFIQAETEVSFWGRGSYRPTEKTIRNTSQSIDTLLGHQPANPGYLALQASALVWQAYWAEESDQQQRLGKRAISVQQTALISRPAHRHSWTKLIEYAERAQGSEALIVQARAGLKGLQRFVFFEGSNPIIK
jgi:hypothetical protein